MRLVITSNGVARGSADLRVAGELHYGSTRQLVDCVTRLLADRPTLRALHIDCSGVSYCDSTGVAALLQIHRKTSARRIELHLDQRPDYLDRILEVTGVLDHLTSRPGDGSSARRNSAVRSRRRDVSDSSADGVGK